jgi:hypothetical protein
VKLQDYRNDFYTFSGKASDLNRQLAFAAIALIWLFKKDIGQQPTISSSLIYPAIFVVISLVLDMLHYCVASIVWRSFYRSKEKQHVGERRNLQHSVWLERPIWIIFVLKILAVVIAYIGIGVFLINTLFHAGT